MTKNETLFIKAVNTALDMSERCVEMLRAKEREAALEELENRSRVINVILQMDQALLTNEEPSTAEFNNLVSRSVFNLNQIDETIIELLTEEKLLTQNEIAKTRKNKENFKGYNLNSLK